MANYNYKITFSYVHKVSKSKYDQYDFGTNNVAGCIIHSDYINNNMPVIILDIAIESVIANIMVDTNNIQNDYIVLNISKYNAEDDMQIELPYISERFNYYTFDSINKRAAIDFADDNPMDKNSLIRTIKLGLIKADSMRANSIVFSGVIKNTTPQNIVQYGLNKAGLTSLVEPFDYNAPMDQVIIPPSTSLSKIIKHLNSLSVFYKTPYRFFIDFDITYLLSSSGSIVVRKGNKINSIVFDIGDITYIDYIDEGMYELKKQGLYYIPVTFNDCQLADNYINSQQYSSITAVTSRSSKTIKPNLKSGDNATTTTKTIRIANDNMGMADNIAASLSNSNTTVSIYKVGVDNSIFTPNKGYSIRYNNTYDESHNGDYLLRSKQEIFIKDGDSFLSSVMLNLAKLGS